MFVRDTMSSHLSVVRRHFICLVSLLQSHVACRNIRELEQQRRQQLRKRHLKKEFALTQTLLLLFHLVYFVKCWQIFWS